MRRVQLPAFRIEPVFQGIARILLRYQLCDIPFAPHPYAEAAVIHFSIVAGFDQVPHLIRPVREIFIQPVVEDQLDRAIEPDKGDGCGANDILHI